MSAAALQRGGEKHFFLKWSEHEAKTKTRGRNNEKKELPLASSMDFPPIEKMGQRILSLRCGNLSYGAKRVTPVEMPGILS